MTRVVVRVANCEGVSERRPADEARLALTLPGGYGLPDVVLFSEVSWLDVKALARREGWDAVQYGTRGSAQAGVAVAARGVIAKSMKIGSLQTREGGGIRLRPLTTGTFDGIDFTAGHAPPERAPAARAQYLARARACRGVVGGDFNQPPAWMRRMSLRKYRGIGVLGLLVPLRYKASAAVAVDIDSDHPAVDVVLTIRNRKGTP